MEVRREIESLVQKIVKNIGANKNICIKTTSPAEPNYLNKRQPKKINFLDLRQTELFGRIMYLMPKIYDLIKQGGYLTVRGLYYSDPQYLHTQQCVQEVLCELSSALGVAAQELHVIPSPKGVVAGNLSFKDNDQLVICSLSTQGVHIPVLKSSISAVQTTAKYILIVEKYTIFASLLNEQFTQSQNCLLITGKGNPDGATINFLELLWDSFKLPAYVLVDWDPHGIEILSIYKYGSKRIKIEQKKTPHIAFKWIGCHHSDYQIRGKDGLLQLSKSDVKKIDALLKRPHFQKEQKWKSELELMIKMNCKYEIESLQDISKMIIEKVEAGHAL